MRTQRRPRVWLRRARNGDLVVLRSAFITAAAIPLLDVPDEVRKRYTSDLNGTRDVYVYGGKVEPAPRFGLKYAGKNLLILGSIDNISTATNTLPESHDHLKNSYPSNAGSARWLINGLYEVKPGPRAQTRLPTNNDALNRYKEILDQTLTGKEFAKTPEPEQHALYDYRCRLIASVSLVGEKDILLRPIVIE